MKIRYKSISKGVSITNDEAFQDYKEFSKIRDKKKFNYYSDYRRVARKIWRKVADSSIEYESGVYDKDFFYLIPQVISNKPFVQLPNGKIKSNDATDGNMYSPIFCNLFPQFHHFCFSLDGTYVQTYKDKLTETINRLVPKYFFILNVLKSNNLR